MALPYRVWFELLTARTQHTFVKEVTIHWFPDVAVPITNTVIVTIEHKEKKNEEEKVEKVELPIQTEKALQQEKEQNEKQQETALSTVLGQPIQTEETVDDDV